MLKEFRLFSKKLINTINNGKIVIFVVVDVGRICVVLLIYVYKNKILLNSWFCLNCVVFKIKQCIIIDFVTFFSVIFL